jgi:hypothetical protein
VDVKNCYLPLAQSRKVPRCEADISKFHRILLPFVAHNAFLINDSRSRYKSDTNAFYIMQMMVMNKCIRTLLTEGMKQLRVISINLNQLLIHQLSAQLT